MAAVQAEMFLLAQAYYQDMKGILTKEQLKQLPQ